VKIPIDSNLEAASTLGEHEDDPGQKKRKRCHHLYRDSPAGSPPNQIEAQEWYKHYDQNTKSDQHLLFAFRLQRMS
jgi:hypothetical protein